MASQLKSLASWINGLVVEIAQVLVIQQFNMCILNVTDMANQLKKKK